MTTSITPPTAPAPVEPTATTPGRTLAVVLACIGAAIAVLLVLGGVLQRIVFGGGANEAHATVSASGAQDVRVAGGMADVRVGFGDVSEATLDVVNADGDADAWSLRREGDAVVVSSPGWAGITFGWFRFNSRDVEVTLTLPRSLEGELDGDFDLGAGSMTVAGEFADVSLQVGAGELVFDGAAETMSADISAGSLRLTSDAPRTLAVNVAAGDADLILSGTAPQKVTGSVSAGDLTLAVPQGEYDVRGEVAAGDRDVQIDTRSSSSSIIDIDVAAGSVTLRYAE